MTYQIHIPDVSAGGMRRMTGELNFALNALAKEVSQLRAELEVLRKEQRNGIYDQTL